MIDAHLDRSQDLHTPRAQFGTGFVETEDFEAKMPEINPVVRLPRHRVTAPKLHRARLVENLDVRRVAQIEVVTELKAVVVVHRERDREGELVAVKRDHDVEL